MWTDHVVYDDTLDKELEEGLDHRNKHVQVHLVSLMIRACISLHIGSLRPTQIIGGLSLSAR